MTLQEFIDDCVAQVAARRAAEQAERDRLEAEFQALLQSVKVSLRGRLIQAIPEPLRPFRDYAGGRPSLDELQGYPIRWTPSSFKVEAPGLRVIKFTTAADDATGPLRIVEIRVGDISFGTDWTEAVAAAKV